jgi:hypothetical protein
MENVISAKANKQEGSEIRKQQCTQKCFVFSWNLYLTYLLTPQKHGPKEYLIRRAVKTA